MSRRIKILSICSLLVCAISYFYQVPGNPPGFYIDASISYNAYTISQTAKDEYGRDWPLYFQAFGEYKNPAYIYLLAGLFRLFGPSILVARALSAALGVIAICLLWLLAFRISRQGLVASLVAISAALTPWLYENSRLVFEVALYPSLLLCFLLVAHRLSEKERWRVVDSLVLTVFLVLLTYSYSIGRLLAPLLAIGLLFFVSSKRWPHLLLTWAIYIISLVPAFVYNYRHGGALMFRFWLLSYITPQSSFLDIAHQFIIHYLGNINPWTITVTGEFNVRDHVGTMGSILAPAFLLGIGGIVLVIRRHRKEPWWRYMLYALAVTPVPASFTTTQFPQVRLVALPILLHVFMVPAFAELIALADTGTGRARQPARITLAVVMLLMIVQGVVYRFQFRAAGPERWYIFDEQFPREVFPTALAQNKLPIYFHDPPGKSGYVEAYWYGLLRGMPANNFVRLAPEEKPPGGVVVISTAEECSDCRLLLKSINYIVYISGTQNVR